MIVERARNSNETWYVSSETDPKFLYNIHFKIHPLSGKIPIWTCNCPDFTERRQWRSETCKHIDEVQYHVHNDLGERGRAKYGNSNWQSAPLLSYTDARARREEFERKLGSVLDSIKELLEAIRR